MRKKQIIEKINELVGLVNENRETLDRLAPEVRADSSINDLYPKLPIRSIREAGSLQDLIRLNAEQFARLAAGAEAYHTADANVGYGADVDPDGKGDSPLDSRQYAVAQRACAAIFADLHELASRPPEPFPSGQVLRG